MDSIRKKRLYIYTVSIVLVLILLYVFMPRSILITPNVTPIDYLATKPSTTLFGITIIVPSSTIFVYLLGIQILLLGYLFLKDNKTVWGYSLLFWGLGTILAGTSYQGLGYELKCAGETYCLFTSWFELAYLFVTAISISLMAIAFSEDFILKEKRKPLVLYAKIALVIYTLLLVLGSIIENSILISYELFTVFFMPLFLVFFIINIINYKKNMDELNKNFIILWILFLIVNVLYYAYYIPGLTESLYENKGVWFSANDVLHVGLIGWFLYMQIKIKPLFKKRD